MKTRWIVENFTNEPSYHALVRALQCEKCDIKQIKGDFKYTDLDAYNDQAPVIFLGSINMTSMVQAHLKNCFPVAYCNQEKYLCTKYMSHFGKYLFNDRYAIVSLAELKRHLFFFYGVFGKETMIFVRPDSGQKPFQAQLVDMQDFERFYNQAFELEHELVVVSSPKNIRGEWRFVVTKHQEIIAQSTYQYNGQRTLVPSAPTGATNLVKELLKIGYYPDSVFVMDICEDSDGNYWLLELNSFSSAGLYECNKLSIVKRVGEIAEREWEEWGQNSLR